MISAFKMRRPWAAFLIALVFGPFVAMLYLGRGWFAVSYLLLTIAVWPLPFLAAHFDLLPVTAESAMVFLFVAIQILGAIHAYRTAGRLKDEVPETIYARWYIVVSTIVILGYGFPFLFRTYLWEPFDIPSGSMEPTLQIGDYLFVSKYAYRSGRMPERGDIVVFAVPGLGGQTYLKRVMGMPGERLQMRDGVLVIDGFPVALEALTLPTPVDGRGQGQIYRETVLNGHSHLIKSWRSNSLLDDTQVFQIPAGHFFMLGDNRDNSQDSRNLARIGYISAEDLVGRVALIVWNSERQKLVFLEAD